MRKKKGIILICMFASIIAVIIGICYVASSKKELTADRVNADLKNFEIEVTEDIFTAEEIIEVIESEEFTVSTEYRAWLDAQVEMLPELDLTAGDSSCTELLKKESEEFRQSIADKVVADYTYTGTEEPLKILDRIEGFSEIESVFILCAIESFTKTGDYSIDGHYSVGEDSCIEFLFRNNFYTVVADKYMTDFLLCKGKLR